MSAHAVSDLSLSESPVKSLCPSRFQLNSFCSYREYNEKTEAEEAEEAEAAKAAEEAAEKEAEEKKVAEEEAAKKAEEEKNKPKPGSPEARVQGALEAKEKAEKEAAEAKAELKKMQEAEDDKEKEKLKEEGKHKELAEKAEEETKKAKDELEVATIKADAADKFASESIESTLKGIKDETKRDAVKKQLEGKSPMDQLSAIGDLLTLAGEGNLVKSLGAGIPDESGVTDKTEISEKESKFKDLLERSQKANKGNGDPLSPSEKREMGELAREIQTHRNKKDAKDE